MGEEEGQNPGDSEGTVCNTIANVAETKKSFLTPGALRAYELTLKERTKGGSGMINEDRAMNNLLSSQPLCFNFFGELKLDLAFATAAMKSFIPQLRDVTDIRFEYAPPGSLTGDNSAFDVACFYTRADGKRGMLGLECKYTDSFSEKEYDRQAYKIIFDRARDRFRKPYERYIQSRYNQPFRNELIAEGTLQNGLVDEARTGLCCHHTHEKCLAIGEEFQEMLMGGKEQFEIIQKDFISEIQRGGISWGRREWLMMLWARYSRLTLSEGVAGTPGNGF